MKIAYLSDIHNEFKNRSDIIKNIDENVDVLVIAGDLNCSANNIIDDLYYIRKLTSATIIYVPGNHDFYTCSYYEECSYFDKNEFKLALDDIHILNNGTLLITNPTEKVNFIGSPAFPDHSNGAIDKSIFGGYNDFNYIREFNTDHLKLGIENREFIKNSLLDDAVNIVITHWLPIRECISETYKNDRYNPCFANDWKEWISDSNIPLWIHGHSHEAGDITLFGTRFVRNPVGYPHEKCTKFDIKKVIEI